MKKLPSLASERGAWASCRISAKSKHGQVHLEGSPGQRRLTRDRWREGARRRQWPHVSACRHRAWSHVPMI